MIANNPRLDEHSTQNNRRRAAEAGRQQAVLAAALCAPYRISRLHRTTTDGSWRCGTRIDNPDGALDLGQSMTPPMTKDAYAALLRRALRGGGGQDSEKRVSR
ncbi:hypothetical protein [Mycolicibacterium neoaurum]|uniref:hypothetical protein n=1 Tax=Mycolicibacterium neoaurum TaxID=1795 RepID=UPI001F4CD8C9|nr:hypothetical protein [Mycolicibacterium neoaurum]